MPKFVAHILLVTLATAVQSVFAQQQLPTFTAHYSVSKGPLKFGKTIRKLSRIDETYFLFQSTTIPKGIATMFTEGEVTEQSKWTVHEEIIRPIEYSYKNTASKKKRNVKLLFDWENKTVTNIINGDPWTMKLIPGTQDKLVYQLSIMLDLAKQQKDLEYLVADGGSLKTYSIKIGNEEQIEIPLGVFNTIKITRTGNNRTTILWCARELNYLPIKIKRVKELGNIVATLYKLEGITIPPSVKLNTKPSHAEDIDEDND